MRQSDLLQLIEKFDLKTQREARKWLTSPVHNTREDVLALYVFICQNLNKKTEKLNKKEVFAHCYPGKPYLETQVNHLMSWLLEALRDYLGWLEWQNDTAHVRLLRSRAMRKMGLDAAFEKEWSCAQSALEQEPFRDEQYHTMSHLLQRERYEHASLQRRADAPPLDVMARHAATAYRLNQLRFECSAAVARTMRKDTQKMDDQINTSKLETIELYENLLAALKDSNDSAAFFEAKKHLESHWQLFRGNERRDLYLLALNFCIRKINGGQREFMRDAFDLYRSGLENQALFEYGQLSHQTFKNAVMAGLNHGEFDWVRHFIEQYREHLPPRDRHSAYSYNLAIWHFWRKDYDAAMTLLRETNIADPMTNLAARVVLLQIYFERGYLEAIESHLESFNTYLRRLKSVGYQRDNYFNLIKFTKKMLRTEKKNKSAKQKLLEEIAATTALAERQWLIKQLEK
jgi:hypothetical protein